MAALVPAVAERIRAVRNPYADCDALAAPLPARRRDPPHLIATGRMVAQKNYGLLLHALAEPALQGCKLTILGDGPDRADLCALAESLCVAGRVAMPGYVANVSERLREADLFVLSSTYEGLPAVAIEALAAGLPVVATDCFLAARELLAGLPGCAVVPPNDAPALAAAIAASLATPGYGAPLRTAAARYSFDAGIADHLRACGPAL